MTKMTDEIISLKNVWTAYEGADRPVIRDISLSVRKGELVIIGGPNGAGKTTLLETIMGLLPVINGTVTVLGRDAVREGCHIRKQVGYVIQNFDFHPYTPFTVGEVVLMGRYGKIGWLKRHSDDDMQVVMGAMNRLGLADLFSSHIGKLSGGQQQKVLIAQNIAKEPVALLLDEPFSNLDIITREEVSRLLCRIVDSGIAVLIVSHAFDALPEHDIRVLVMQDGRIVLDELTRPEKVMNTVRSASVAS